jgi:hypothetical protein
MVFLYSTLGFQCRHFFFIFGIFRHGRHTYNTLYALELVPASGLWIETTDVAMALAPPSLLRNKCDDHRQRAAAERLTFVVEKLRWKFNFSIAFKNLEVAARLNNLQVSVNTCIQFRDLRYSLPWRCCF